MNDVVDFGVHDPSPPNCFGEFNMSQSAGSVVLQGIALFLF